MHHKNPTEPTVQLNVGENAFTLFFSFEALATAEDLTGLPLVLGLRKKDIDTPRVSFVRAMLFGCLLTHHPDMTYEDAAALVTGKTIQAIWAKVLEAWMASMKEEKDAGNPQLAQS